MASKGILSLRCCWVKSCWGHILHDWHHEGAGLLAVLVHLFFFSASRLLSFISGHFFFSSSSTLLSCISSFSRHLLKSRASLLLFISSNLVHLFFFSSSLHPCLCCSSQFIRSSSLVPSIQAPRRPLHLKLSDAYVYEPSERSHHGTERILQRGGLSSRCRESSLTTSWPGAMSQPR